MLLRGEDCLPNSMCQNRENGLYLCLLVKIAPLPLAILRYRSERLVASGSIFG